MPERRLSPEESEIWDRVAATVRRIDGRIATKGAAASVAAPQDPKPTALNLIRPKLPITAPPPAASPDTLDGGWDRRLRRGVVSPDRTIDLHGHTLATAHAALDHGIERSIVDGVRVLLIVTGKPPKGEAPHRRGLIRASIGDWLASSRHVGRIAAVRNAHPRHGGSGALYLILRRARTG